MRRVKATPAPKQFIDEQGAQAARQANLKVGMMMGKRGNNTINNGVKFSAPKSCIQRFVITEKAPTRAFSWLKAATTAFTFETHLRHV